jgi:hypothetical protein
VKWSGVRALTEWLPVRAKPPLDSAEKLQGSAVEKVAMKLREFFERDILISLSDKPAGFHARVKCGGLRFPKRFIGICEPQRSGIMTTGGLLSAAPPLDIETAIEPRIVRSPKDPTKP